MPRSKDDPRTVWTRMEEKNLLDACDYFDAMAEKYGPMSNWPSADDTERPNGGREE